MSGGHLAAFFGAFPAFFGALPAVDVVVLGAFFGAFFADFGADAANGGGGPGVAGHEADGGAADGGAVDVGSDALGEFGHADLVETSGGTVVACVGASVAGVDAVLVVVFHICDVV